MLILEQDLPNYIYNLDLHILISFLSPLCWSCFLNHHFWFLRNHLILILICLLYSKINFHYLDLIFHFIWSTHFLDYLILWYFDCLKADQLHLKHFKSHLNLFCWILCCFSNPLKYFFLFCNIAILCQLHLLLVLKISSFYFQFFEKFPMVFSRRLIYEVWCAQKTKVFHLFIPYVLLTSFPNFAEFLSSRHPNWVH